MTRFRGLGGAGNNGNNGLGIGCFGGRDLQQPQHPLQILQNSQLQQQQQAQAQAQFWY